jgi:hypothetical protein
MNDTPRTDSAARHIDGFADEWVPRYVSEELERELHEAHAYADRLVAHKDMVCLPADLKNLREANAHFAAENALLKNAIANDRDADAAAAEAEEFAKFRAYKENQVAQYTGTNAGLNIGLYLANQDIIELTEQRDSYKERYTKLAGKYAVEIHELTEQRDRLAEALQDLVESCNCIDSVDFMPASMPEAFEKAQQALQFLTQNEL